MEKKINIEELSRQTPFKVPEGYFEGLTSRVMSSIPAEEVSANVSAPAASSGKKAKVVGLLPHRKKNGWMKWAAAAAVVCGIAFFMANSQNGNEEGSATQLANVKTTAAPAQAAADESEPDNLTASTSSAYEKTYANGAYDLSSHVRRSSTPAPANITVPVAVKPLSTTARTSNVQMASVKTPATGPSTSSVTMTASQKPTVQQPAATTAAIAANSTNTAADAYAMEYDMLDYTNMSGTEVYDYLAGNEYY